MWIKVKLKDISSSINSGITPSRSNSSFWANGKIPWLKTNQIGTPRIYSTDEKITQKAFEETSLKMYPINTISMALYGEGQTRGRVSILKSSMTTNQACCNIVLNPKKAYYEFVYYYLKNKYSYLRSISSGVRKNLNSNLIKELEILIPENISDQEKLVSILSALDQKIELNNKINAELEAMAKTIYDYWFVQFDFPDKNGKPYKSSGGKMVWNEELKREIPEGWGSSTIGEYARVKSGFAFKSSWWQESGQPVLKIGDITEDYKISIEKLTFISAENASGKDSFLAQGGDVVIAMTGATIGKFGIIPQLESGILINQRVGLFELGANPFLKLPFLFNSLKQSYFREAIFRIASGCAQPNISAEQINSIPCSKPFDDLIAKYNQTLQTTFQGIIKNIAENTELIKLRDFLLPMLMNGQVRVK